MIALEERFKRSLPVRFTVDELRGKADELADKVARREQLEEEKKRVAADYKARVDSITSDVNLLARHITEKCEYQQVECQAWLDHPEYGKKTIFRCDTGEQVGVETMQYTDRQTAIKWQRSSEDHDVDSSDSTTAQQPDRDPIEAAEETFAASIDDGVVDHDSGGSSHEGGETLLEMLGQKKDEE